MTGVEPKTAVVFSELPVSLQTKLGGCHQALVTKMPAKIWLDADVLAAMRATGDDWETRGNDCLRAALRLAGKLV